MTQKKSKPQQVWGLRTAAFYADLEGKPVLVAVLGGKRFKGTLVGVDTYDIIIKQYTGLKILVPKGSIVYVHRASAPSDHAQEGE